MFSTRVPAQLEPNALARAVRRARAGGRLLLDLTVSNPTSAGIEYDPAMFTALAQPAVVSYAPDPFGLAAAREAVSRDYRRRALDVDPARVVLTSSTSEAYALLFKLLCDPGDAVLAPVPSYPLFDHLTRLEGVTARPYRLEYHGRWQVDADSVDEAWTDRVRALLAVSPNNPTGSVLSGEELSALSSRCAARRAALIVDEVFADYPLGDAEAPIRNAPAGDAECLTIRLGGLSKSAGLPQVKLGWMALDGPPRLVEEALARLEVICDTYLSVSTPVQVAAAGLIARGSETRARILERVRGNYAVLRERARRHPSVDVHEAEGGWSAVLRVPARGSEEELVLNLIERDGVLVHPGYFFDFPHEAFLVVSLLPLPAAFAAGLGRLLERVDA
jgi:alanine-synthesizing transaminase